MGGRDQGAGFGVQVLLCGMERVRPIVYSCVKVSGFGFKVEYIVPESGRFSFIYWEGSHLSYLLYLATASAEENGGRVNA